MTIKKIIISINDLIKKTDDKNEKKIYNTFSNIIISIENLNLTEKQLLLILNKIEELNLSSIQGKKIKYLKVKLEEFKKFLKDDLSLVQEGYYIWIWMTIWMLFWMMLGISLGFEFGMGDETTWWLITGMIVWMLIWSIMDSKTKKENRNFKI